jgi:ABC-type multidrug transport system ATPase subunit
MSVIEVENLSKNFGDVKALDSISFSVNRGELFGLIGPDGAGNYRNRFPLIS